MVRRLKRQAERTYRRLTATRRALPDYLIVGAQKAGTSSLYVYVNQHPQLIRPRPKEMHFFGVNYEKGIDWYQARMPLKAQLERAPNGITGGPAPTTSTTHSCRAGSTPPSPASSSSSC